MQPNWPTRQTRYLRLTCAHVGGERWENQLHGRWSAWLLCSRLLASVGACGDDDDEGTPTPDAGAGRGGGGGRGGSGGSSGRGGGTSDASDAGSCTVAVATACDGPEDCPTGQRCCGKWDEEYVEFGCYASCIAQTGDSGAGPGGGPLWFDMCHPGDACEDSTAMCLTSPYLPTSFSRCYDSGDPPNPALGNAANQVNCGTDVCTSGEKCCLRGSTLEPYCAPTSATCACDPPDPGTDAGDAAPDTSQDAAPDSSDAAPDSSDAAPDSSDATAG